MKKTLVLSGIFLVMAGALTTGQQTERSSVIPGQYIVVFKDAVPDAPGSPLRLRRTPVGFARRRRAGRRPSSPQRPPRSAERRHFARQRISHLVAPTGESQRRRRTAAGRPATWPVGRTRAGRRGTDYTGAWPTGGPPPRGFASRRTAAGAALRVRVAAR